jgi:putative transposase
MKYRYFQYRLKPTGEQYKTLDFYGSATRWVWNHFLELNQKEYEANKKFVFLCEMSKLLTELKKERTWLKEVPRCALQQKLMDLEKVIKNCYKNKFGFPKFKKKKHQSDSFRIPQSSGETKLIKCTKKSIYIPKLGWVKWIKHRPLKGEIKSITVKQNGQHWYVSVMCEQEDDLLMNEVNSVIGLDFGLSSFVTDSTGNRTESPKIYQKKLKELKRRQRKLSRCMKGSNRRNKQRLRVAKLHQKIANIRKDFLHKLSRTIAKSVDVVGIEDLNIKGIGKNLHMAKSIFDSGWGFFTWCLEYKMREKGGYLVKIDRFYPSSKICSHCGQIKPMPLHVRTYECDCGFVCDRDTNAALNIQRKTINILNWTGMVQIQARGDTSGGDVAYAMAYDTSGHVSVNREKFLSQGKEAAFYRAR